MNIVKLVFLFECSLGTLRENLYVFACLCLYSDMLASEPIACVELLECDHIHFKSDLVASGV